MRTAEWDLVEARIREMALFSATVEDARYLEEMKARLEERLAVVPVAGRSTMDRAKFVAEMQPLAEAAGLRPQSAKDGRGGLTDPGSKRRLELIWDIQVQLAQGRARWLAETDPDVLALNPAWEFKRLASRKEWRDWPQRWIAAGLPAPTAPGGDYGMRMVALKSDPGWARLSRFGLPWAPFDFGSGMGLVTIRRKEAQELGLLQPLTKVEPPPEPEPEPVVELPRMTDAAPRVMRSQFGDMAEVNRDKKTIAWRGPRVAEIAEAVSAGRASRALPVSFSLGQAGRSLADVLGYAVTAASQLILNRDTRVGDGVTPADVRALMTLWRNGEASADGSQVTLTLPMPGGRTITAIAWATAGGMVVEKIFSMLEGGGQ